MLNLVVLYVTDLDRSVRFYTSLGLVFEAEKHGRGPAHYASVTDSGLVLELYPAGEREPTRTRLGFAVDDTDVVLDALIKAGVIEPQRRVSGAVNVVVRDPDGNAVSLME